MSIIANDIPFEIWELIANHVPHAQRPRLISLSRYFFYIVLHERYGDIRWTILDKEMTRYLQRLQDPFVARFVQKIHIQAWFINHLVKREALLRESERKSLLILQSLAEYMNLGSYLPASWTQQDARARFTQHTPGEILSLMVNALSQMTNLACYSFQWRDLPITKDSQAFLEAAQRSARGLRKLVLHAQIPNFKHLLNCVDFEHLEELSFQFDYDASNNKNGPDDSIQSNMEIMRTNIAGFINRFTHTLHHLSLTSDSKVPIVCLFESLATFPNLRRLELNMSFDTINIPTTDSLLHFLTFHSSSLLHVKLNPPSQRIPQVSYNPITPTTTIVNPSLWTNMNRLLQSSTPNVLSDLESLHLPASIPFETIMMLLRRSANTLTRLSLPGRYLYQNEVETICDIFSQRPLYASLLHLHLDVVKFNLTLLAEIAKRFPSLESLILVTFGPPNLAYKDYTTSLDPFTYEYYGGPITPVLPPEATLLPHILQILGDWKLEDFSIYAQRYQEHQTKSFVGAGKEHHAMMRVKQYVPSIRYFKGEEATDGSELKPIGVFYW